MKKHPLFLLAILLSCSSTTFSQVIKGTEKTIPWRIIGVNNNFPGIDDNEQYDKRSGIIYISPEEAIVAAQFGIGANGLVRVNQKLQEKWKMELQASLLGLSKLGDKILLLYTTDWKKGKFSKFNSVNARLIDPETGKVLADKKLLTVDDNAFAHIQLFKSADGNFQQLMVRKTEWKREGMIPAIINHEPQMTEKTEFYAIDPFLETSLIGSHTSATKNLQFLRSTVTSQGDVYILWADNDNLLAQHFPKNPGAATTKISLPLDWKIRKSTTAVIEVNPANPQIVAASVWYTNKGTNIKTVLFNFALKNAKSIDESLERDYSQQLEQQVEVPAGEKKEIRKNYFSGLQPRAILFYENKPVLIREVIGTENSGSSGRNIRYYCGEALISVYDVNLATPKHFLINKFYEAFIGGPGQSWGHHIKDEHLIFLTNDVAGPAMYQRFFGKINLKSMKWEQWEQLKKGTTVVKSAVPIECDATLWFPRGAVLHELNKSFFQRDIDSKLLLMEY